MGSFEESLDDADYGFLATMDEVLLVLIEQVELARQAEPEMLKFRLAMASRAMRCALEIYLDWSAHNQVPGEEK